MLLGILHARSSRFLPRYILDCCDESWVWTGYFDYLILGDVERLHDDPWTCSSCRMDTLLFPDYWNMTCLVASRWIVNHVNFGLNLQPQPDTAFTCIMGYRHYATATRAAILWTWSLARGFPIDSCIRVSWINSFPDMPIRWEPFSQCESVIPSMREKAYQWYSAPWSRIIS